jgi:DNA processing protein
MKRQITPRSAEWPGCLSELGSASAPRRLYVEGLPLEPDMIGVAVVGTRRPSAAGVEVAFRMGRGLAEAGIVVISGLAVGIDATAHRAALEGGGRTIAVLGCGLDIPYPARNINLKERIRVRGTLMTEYDDGAEPRKSHFPLRNRIIAGLSIGVVVVEGSPTSGALITARLALEANRSVYAVPGSVRNPMAAGPNHLIRTSAAGLVTCVEDVVEDLFGSLGALGSKRPPPRRGRRFEEDEVAVLAALDDVPVALDVVVGITGVPHGRAAVIAANLELEGLAARRPGGYCTTAAGASALASVV